MLAGIIRLDVHDNMPNSNVMCETPVIWNGQLARRVQGSSLPGHRRFPVSNTWRKQATKQVGSLASSTQQAHPTWLPGHH